MLRRLIPLLIVPLLLGLIGCSDRSDYGSKFELPSEAKKNNKITLKFGRVPSVTVTELLRRNAPLIRLLKDELDVNITYRFADDYRGIIDGMIEENYNFTWLGPYSYVLSECSSETSANYKPLVQPMRRNQSGNLSADYRSIIFTGENSTINSPSDLKGKSLAFVEKQSTSGYLFPKSLLLKSGLKPGEDFTFEFLDRHDRVVQTVLNGKHDAGATYNGARVEQLENRSKANTKLPIIAETRPIPNEPITVSKAFANNNPEIVQNFVDIMTSLHKTKRGKSILKNLNIQKYRKVSDEDYDEVRNVVRQLGDELPAVKTFCEYQSPPADSGGSEANSTFLFESSN